MIEYPYREGRLMSDSETLRDCVRLYDEAPIDAEFEPGHPIFQLAFERDTYMHQLRAFQKATGFDTAEKYLKRGGE